jgi:Mg/Co/Ni transporter MgtE
MAPASITSLGTRIGTRRPPVSATRLVADVTNTALVRLPVWFTVAQALRVAKLKKVDHLLVEEHGRVAGSISATALMRAPAGDALGRWMGRSQAHVAPEHSLAEAEAVFRREGVGCLPVVRSGLLIGTVRLDDVAGDVAHAA